MEAQIKAYARGWHDALAWQTPHLNPYPVRSPEWEAWEAGYEDSRHGEVAVVPQLQGSLS